MKRVHHNFNCDAVLRMSVSGGAKLGRRRQSQLIITSSTSSCSTRSCSLIAYQAAAFIEVEPRPPFAYRHTDGHAFCAAEMDADFQPVPIRQVRQR